MAEVELIIKIDEEDYEIMKHNIAVNNPLCPLSQEEMVSKVANGVLLPKGYSKLIAEPTEEDIAKTIGGQNDFADCIRDAVKAVFDNAPSVVKSNTSADK